MSLPPWIADVPHKDNWMAVAKLRAQTEAANPASDPPKKTEVTPPAIAWVVDDHHDF
jgi:hypothetical protein